MTIFQLIDKKLTRFMNYLSDAVGRPWVFAAVFLLGAGWFVVGIFLEYDTWFDIMDVFIFLSSFYLLFLLQASQNADTEAIQEKLDEIIDSLPNTNKKKEGEEKKLKRGEKKQKSDV